MEPEASTAVESVCVGAATDVGNVRELNEDTILAKSFTTPGPFEATAVLMVADGVGGHHAGEIASGLAADTVRSVLIDLSEGTSETLRGRMIEAVAETNSRVYACAGPESAHPATTLTLFACTKDEYTVVHVGDSRAYILRGDEAQQITDDDSWVGEAVKRGQMTLAEAEVSPFRNQITKCVGSAPSVDPTVYSGEWRPGDVALLTSDGLTEYVAPAEMLDEVRGAGSIQAACDRLVLIARERGGHDNISVVAAVCSGLPSPVRKPPTAPLSSPTVSQQHLRNGMSMVMLAACLLCAAAVLIGIDLRIRQRSTPANSVQPSRTMIRKPTVHDDKPSNLPSAGGDSPANIPRVHRRKDSVKPGKGQDTE